MNAEAIQKIQELTQAASIGNPGTDVPTLLVPSGFKLASLEAYMDAPKRFRGCFTTRSLADYAEYVNIQDAANVYVDIDNMSAEAFFDIGDSADPGHGEHTARLQLERTAPYAAMAGAHGATFGQRDLAHWIEDWHAHIEGEDSSGNSMSPGQLAAAVRRIDIKSTSERSHEDGDWNASRSGLDRLDARTGGAIPAVIRFTCTPYEYLSVHTFELRVSILTDSDKPKLKLRAIGLEAQQEEIAQEFKATLAEHLDEPATLLLGTFDKR